MRIDQVYVLPATDSQAFSGADQNIAFSRCSVDINHAKVDIEEGHDRISVRCRYFRTESGTSDSGEADASGRGLGDSEFGGGSFRRALFAQLSQLVQFGPPLRFPGSRDNWGEIG